MAQTSLAKRVEILEQKLEQLTAKLQPAEEKPWWQEVAGTFANDPIYDEAMRLGREYRESLRPAPEKKPPSRRARKRNGDTRHGSGQPDRAK